MRHCSSGSGKTASPQPDDVLSALEARFNALANERAAAPELVAELLALPLGGQRELAARSRAAFHTVAVAELLIERSGEAEPPPALDLARTAVAIADRVDPQRYSPSFVQDLRSRAWTQLGRARRLVGDLEGAGRALSVAERLGEDGSSDPLEEGHLLEEQAALLADRSDSEAAIELLVLAAKIYESVGDGARAARARRTAEETPEAPPAAAARLTG